MDAAEKMSKDIKDRNEERDAASADDTDGFSDDSRCGAYSPTDRKTDRNKRQGLLASKCLNEDELQGLRLKINSRERRRMHDLNSALDGLREVMPYANGPSVRKLSKIATLLLAKNYILMLNSSLEEMKKLLSDIYQTHPPRSVAPPAHVQSTHVQHVPQLSMVPTIPSIPVSGIHSHEFSTLHSVPTSAAKESPTSIHTPLAAHDRHMLYNRWPAPCACTHCTMDTLRVSYSSIGTKYPSHMTASPSFRK